MADLTTSTKISESDRQVVYAFQYQYIDGGNESAVLKVDVSGLDKMMQEKVAPLLGLLRLGGRYME